MTGPAREPFDLGPMPAAAIMRTVDQRAVAVPAADIFALARDVERWPALLSHYRAVRFIERTSDGGGVVTMRAVRPFGPFDWPASWTSEMQVHDAPGDAPWIRFRHVRGVTRRMEVLWAFREHEGGAATTVTILHLWNGPGWPLIGAWAARHVVGPVFVHGIASLTLAGLAGVAERRRHA
ncbi:MAG: SRPBCC family protein [Gemmatimonadota bacterium]|nr:SRPBCC family protein [Gemmatimonadota bacterium]